MGYTSMGKKTDFKILQNELLLDRMSLLITLDFNNLSELFKFCWDWSFELLHYQLTAKLEPGIYIPLVSNLMNPLVLINYYDYDTPVE